MALTPVRPRPDTGPDLRPRPDPPPGTADAPDGIPARSARSRRRRRRWLAVAAAVLAAAVVAGLLSWPDSPAPPRQHVPVIHPASPATRPGRARHPGAVIHMARARHHRRRQRTAQATADTIGAAAGTAAAGGLRSLLRPRTTHPPAPGSPAPAPKT